MNADTNPKHTRRNQHKPKPNANPTRTQDLHIPRPRLSGDVPTPSHELLDFVGGLLHKDACKRLDVVGAMRCVWGSVLLGRLLALQRVL